MPSSRKRKRSTTYSTITSNPIIRCMPNHYNKLHYTDHTDVWFQAAKEVKAGMEFFVNYGPTAPTFNDYIHSTKHALC